MTRDWLANVRLESGSRRALKARQWVSQATGCGLRRRLANTALILWSVPLHVQRESLSFASLADVAPGRRRGNCHPGELGAALRRLGFERRDWSGSDGFRAIWRKVG